ncbi:MAG: bifunctional glutamate N-acetyltransferase/amino-acid acetyltransferase ArgJ [Coriobacteriales bacterium]|jgi:glutamate N-acetyltransferase/amino-acid N-acetyltransferase
MTYCDLTYIEGGVTAPTGIRAVGAHLGFRKDPERLDTALVVADGPHASSAAVFTQNKFCAAPVQVSRKVREGKRGRAVLLNSGIANAATGNPGIMTAVRSAELCAQALDLSDDEVFVASTGVIGVSLPLEPFETGMGTLVEGLTDEGGHAAAQAIMTTDTHPKECAFTFEVAGATYHIGGMCKGSGMISPNMATMLAVIATDCPVESASAQTALKAAVDVSFNKVTVDSDTSTNDSVFFLSSGAVGDAVAAQGVPGLESELFEALSAALDALCQNLARQIAADGEGATKLVTVNVRGAKDEADADLAARTVANSPLVKTAIAGHDCNWGRIAAALGRSGATFEQEDVDIDIMEMPVLRDGLPVAFDEDEALKRFEQDEIVIDVDLGQGEAETSIWTCDLTHEYIHINADYRS